MPTLSQIPGSIEKCKRVFDALVKLRNHGMKISKDQIAAHAGMHVQNLDAYLIFLGFNTSFKRNWWSTIKVRQSQFFRRLDLAEILNKDPHIHWHELVKLLGVKNDIVYNDIKWLADNKFQGAVKRVNLHKEKSNKAVERTPKNENKVRKYALANPYANIDEIAENVGISSRAVRDLISKIIKENPSLKKKIRLRRQSLTVLKRREDVFAYKAKHPLATQREIGKAVKISEAHVRRIMAAVVTEHNDRNPERVAEVLAMTMNEYASILRVCDEKLSKITNPTVGARWFDHKIKVLENISKLFNLTGPDVQINQVNILTKESRDAVAGALRKDIEMQKVIKLPDFKNESKSKSKTEKFVSVKCSDS